MAGVVSALSSVVQTADGIRASIDKWYDVSGQMKLFYDQLCRLKDDHQIWEDQIRKFGLSNDEDLLQKIRGAQAVLDEEKNKLFREDGSARLSSKAKRWFFRAKLESSIRNVTSSCEDLSRFLKRKEEIQALARQRAIQRTLQDASSFSFTSDSRYVPLRETEEKVKKALEDTEGSSIILLHGGSGTGKSALARNLALHFQQETHQRSSGALSGSSQSSNSNGAVFERVLYLECGPDVSLEAQQRELVKQLDSSSSNYDTTGADANGKAQVTDLLSSLLKERSLLIILDDVWKSEKIPANATSTEWPSFLKGMIRYGGTHVKWLITSQSRDLCDHLDVRTPCLIGMEKIADSTARRILASLTRLNEDIPSKIQDVMDRIIHNIGGNLYALTCVASTMRLERNTEETEWKQLENDLLATLKSENAIKMQGIHSPSFWAATKFSFERLSDSQQYLLHLMQMCSGPSVPSAVIEYLFQKTKKRSWCGISEARKELEGKHFLTIKRAIRFMSEVEESWSIHDLLKLFIEEDLDTLVESKIESFIEGVSTSKLESDVLLNLAYLYFNEHCRSRLANKMSILSKMAHLADLKKEIVSPIAKLLMWADTSSLRSSSLQVILRYITDGIFDDVHTSNLLTLSASQAAMLLALENSAFGGHHPIIGQQIISTLLTLLGSQTAHLVTSPQNHASDPDVGDLLCRTSYAFATALNTDKKETKAIHFTSARFQIILDRLTSGLLRFGEMNKWCALALVTLTIGGRDIGLKMIDTPGLVQNLVAAMGNSDSPDCKAQAACALAGLATNGSKIADFSGVLEALRTGLENPKNVQLQKWSGWALANLANSNDDVRSTIISCEGVVSKLVSLMVEADNHEVKKQFARALANLAAGGSDIELKMIDAPGLVQNLVAAMGNSDSPDCKAQAARALAGLATNGSKIADFSGVLEALRTGLENPKNVQLQKWSGWALANLANSNDDVRSTIISCEGVVSKLVSLMVEADNHEVKEQCARALANVANGGSHIKLKMIDVPGLVQNLVAAMGNSDSADCKAQAARALAGLAHNTSKIADFSGVLEALRTGLETPKNVQLQKWSGWALANLANSNDDVRSTIISCEGVVSKLVSLMVEADNHEVKKQFARALANLAAGGSDIELKMIDAPGLVHNLVAAMGNSDSPDCKAEAARALAGLATNTSKIADLSGVLEALRTGLETPKNVQLQKWSGWALANLANSNDDVRSTIISCEGVVSKLVSLMVEADNHEVKKQFARALANLAAGGSDIELKMIDAPGLVHNLVAAMGNSDSPDCKAEAARALAGLATNTSKIADLSGVLEALRTGLETPKNVQLQKWSGWALANLANSNDDVRSTIISCEGVVNKLVSLMVEADNHEVKEKCARALANLAGGGSDIELKMIDAPGLVQNLVAAMGNSDSPDCKAEAARALANLPTNRSKIADFSGVLEALRTGLENPKNVQLQKWSAWALANLATFNDEVRSKIMACDGVLRMLVSLMVEVDNHDVMKACARALANVARGGAELGTVMVIFPEISDVLVDAIAKGDNRNSSLHDGMFVLTLLSPRRAKEMELNSAEAYSGRAGGELILSLYKECLQDCDRAMASLSATTTENPNACDALRLICALRCCAKAKLGDFQGALADADNLVQMATGMEWELGYALQERGVLKRMMDDLIGSLADLDVSLDSYKEDDYEVLKHRGFVKFLLRDEEGARADAERALRCRPSCVDDTSYGRNCLGVSSVHYLDFDLR